MNKYMRWIVLFLFMAIIYGGLMGIEGPDSFSWKTALISGIPFGFFMTLFFYRQSKHKGVYLKPGLKAQAMELLERKGWMVKSDSQRYTKYKISFWNRIIGLETSILTSSYYTHITAPVEIIDTLPAEWLKNDKR